MKTEYIRPITEPVPLLANQSMCLTSIEQRMLEEGLLDDDSD